MRFTVETTINTERHRVWNAFNNYKKMKRWQPTLESFETQSGTPGHVGAISKLIYREHGRTLVLSETITRRQEPIEIAGTYASQGVVNHLRNTFIELNPAQTRWTLDADVKFTGMMAVLAPLMRHSLIKQTQADMQRFKAMVENY